MNSIKAILLGAMLVFNSALFAANPPLPDEGMWLPLLLKDMNYAEMQRLGCRLSPEQIYSVNNSSVKDAIVQLGGFCTAEVVSPKGLMLTNHHCAYDAIASQSTVEHDYLTDGFWAKSHAEELPIEGLSVSFLVRMEDVTERMVNKADGLKDMQRQMAMMQEIADIEAEASEDDRYVATVKDMFDGNAYYVFVYEVYSDIRLVGAPPSSIGKFGGDTDNWMWPRHTGDFSMLRIYASPENTPAPYSADNKPYVPKHYLPVSTKGLKEGDYTMIMGYPGSTDRYMTSHGVKNLMEVEGPTIVKTLEKRLAVMKAEMDQDDAVRIALASNYASLANTYKYYKGQLLGLNKFNLPAEKETQEKAFEAWVAVDEDRKNEYGDALSQIQEAFATHGQTNEKMSYLNMAGFGPGFIGPGIPVWRLKRTMEAAESEDDYADMVSRLEEQLDDLFEGYFKHVDQKVFAATTHLMMEGLPADDRPDFFTSKAFTKAKGEGETKCANYAAAVFKKSIIVDKARLKSFLAKPSLKKLEKDPGVAYIISIINYYRQMQTNAGMFEQAVAMNREVLLKGMMEMEDGKSFYPDANFTMRVTYGTVKPYSSWEGKPYESFTWASQILDKYKPGDQEFDVPEGLRNLIAAKDFGPYGKDGKLPVCFIHDLDITGGNSGSPVINGDGELVGIAFDGNWESMISDLRFQDEYVRTISVDIRYVLFVIDKFAGAKHLVDEMTLKN